MLPICFNICIFVKFQKSEIHPPIACCTGVTMTCIQKMILGLIQGRTQNFLFGGGWGADTEDVYNLCSILKKYVKKSCHKYNVTTL